MGAPRKWRIGALAPLPDNSAPRPKPSPVTPATPKSLLAPPPAGQVTDPWSMVDRYDRRPPLTNPPGASKGQPTFKAQPVGKPKLAPLPKVTAIKKAARGR